MNIGSIDRQIVTDLKKYPVGDISCMARYYKVDMNNTYEKVLHRLGMNIFSHHVSHLPTNSDDPALFDAILGNDYDRIRELVEDESADVNEVSRSKTSPLMEAAAYSHPSIVKYLIDHGADVNQVASAANLTPIFYAIRRKSQTYKVLRILLENGADTTVKNALGVTPFIQACKNNDNIEAIMFLGSIPGALDEKDKKGRPGMYYLKKNGQKKAINSLKVAKPYSGSCTNEISYINGEEWSWHNRPDAIFNYRKLTSSTDDDWIHSCDTIDDLKRWFGFPRDDPDKFPDHTFCVWLPDEKGGNFDQSGPTDILVYKDTSAFWIVNFEGKYPDQDFHVFKSMTSSSKRPLKFDLYPIGVKVPIGNLGDAKFIIGEIHGSPETLYLAIPPETDPLSYIFSTCKTHMGLFPDLDRPNMSLDDLLLQVQRGFSNLSNNDMFYDSDGKRKISQMSRHLRDLYWEDKRMDPEFNELYGNATADENNHEYPDTPDQILTVYRRGASSSDSDSDTDNDPAENQHNTLLSPIEVMRGTRSPPRIVRHRRRRRLF